MALGPLSEDTVRELTADQLDAPPSPTLAALTALSGKAFELGAVTEPFGQPAGIPLPLVEEATDVGVIAGVGDRLVFTQPLFWQAVLESLPEPMRAGARGESVRPDEPVGPPRAPRPSSPQIATRINRWPRTVNYHLRKMFGTLSVRSRSELAGTVRQRLWEAP
ncbi:hypothetical protein [Streptomyces mirabilis]|uniref:hypothetical protein n=1 Tax=Streptomyces mirabilis TaxID=68239 RepID=UPI0033BD969F